MTNKTTGEILIVEDSQTQAMMLQYLLESHGFKVLLALNGTEGLALIKAHKPLLVISDIIMPEMDGWELCRIIKSDTEIKDIPVILLTALSEPKDILNGLKCGADSFLIKPPTKELLFSRIDYLVSNMQYRKYNYGTLNLELFFSGEKHIITPERIQILNLLITNFENYINQYTILEKTNGELREARKALARQSEELKELSIRDGLTGLYNRRGFFTIAEQQLKIVCRDKESALLIYFDIDEMKKINDSFGHAEGDKALINMTNVLKNTFRESDLLARIGGDEFVVLCVTDQTYDFEIIQNRLVENLKKQNACKGMRFCLSLTLGTAKQEGEDTYSLEELLSQADQELFDKKRRIKNGRNPN
ncbi:MAG: diguanylate cyclase [Bacteroidetes bacterium]|nr:diguanylate cyclase [Bacteroidota bacterium]